MNKRRSLLFVFIQFACIALILLTGPLLPIGIPWKILALIAILVGAWSVIIMTGSKLNVFPEIRTGAILIKKGPYRLIRHPMYLAVLLFCLSLVTDKFSVFRLVIFLILMIDLIFKMKYEESLLESNFPDYAGYKKSTWKLLPFIY